MSIHRQIFRKLGLPAQDAHRLTADQFDSAYFGFSHHTHGPRRFSQTVEIKQHRRPLRFINLDSKSGRRNQAEGADTTGEQLGEALPQGQFADERKEIVAAGYLHLRPTLEKGTRHLVIQDSGLQRSQLLFKALRDCLFIGRVDQLAAVGDKLQSLDKTIDRAVFQRMGTACLGGDVAADATDIRAGDIGGQKKPRVFR